MHCSHTIHILFTYLKILKISLTVLLTYLKIILLYSVFNFVLVIKVQFKGNIEFNFWKVEFYSKLQITN